MYTHMERQSWLIDQQREKLWMLHRHLARLRKQRGGMARVMSLGELVRYRQQPFEDALRLREERWARAMAELAAYVPGVVEGVPDGR
ncbi:hypothetical protein [Kitasatospora fiedleri]|uniref:hypothetical protein n=1 Tax=Kitasatospora fiedleri TaxID=2991545 RepID=UPI00249BF7AA|nr:hypothetical protein [Kitasatospora fiedleri]